MVCLGALDSRAPCDRWIPHPIEGGLFGGPGTLATTSSTATKQHSAPTHEDKAEKSRTAGFSRSAGGAPRCRAPAGGTCLSTAKIQGQGRQLRRSRARSRAYRRLRRRLRGERPRSGEWGPRSRAAVVACGRLCPGFPVASSPGGNHPGLGGVKPDHTLLWLRLVRLDTAQSGMVVQAPPKRRGIRDNPHLWERFRHLAPVMSPPRVRTEWTPSTPQAGLSGFPVASAGVAKLAGPVVSSR